MSRLNIAIPQEQRDALQAALDPKQLRSAIYQVVLRTTNYARRAVDAELRKHTTLSSKYAKRVVTVIRPQGDPPVGQVVIDKKPIPLIAFGPKRNGRNGLTVRYIDDDPAITFRHAFLATMPNASPDPDAIGHRGGFQRMRASAAGSVRRTKRGNMQVTAKGVVWRLPIEELFGRSIFSILNVPELLEEMETDIDEYMEKQTASQISRFFSQSSAASAAASDADDAAGAEINS